MVLGGNVLMINLTIMTDMFFNSLTFNLSFKFYIREYHE